MFKDYVRELSAEEIKSVYYAVLAKDEKSVYNTALPLKIAALSNFKGLTPAFSYGYYYEPVNEDNEALNPTEPVVPLALNYIFGYNKAKNPENGLLIYIDRLNPKDENGDDVITIELFGGAGDIIEIPIDKFAELFDNKEFSEENIKLLSDYIDFDEFDD